MEKEVKEALKKNKINDDETKKYSTIILTVMSIVASNNPTPTTWKMQHYYSKSTEEYFIAFVESVNSMYVSCYGNLYSNEEHFLQSLNKMKQLTKVLKYESDTNNEASATERDIIIIDDDDYLFQVSKCFKKLNKKEVFANFVSYIAEEEPDKCEMAIKLLYKMKFYFYFFYHLNRYDKVGVTFDSSNKVLICFPSFHFVTISVEIFEKNPDSILAEINFFQPKKAKNYIDVINECGQIDVSEKNNRGTHETDLAALSLSLEQIDILHFVGVKMLEVLTNYFKLSHLRKVISWLQWRFQDEVVAILFYIHNRMKLYNEYQFLLQVVRDCKPKITHHFANEYTAGEHFCKHYRPIKKLPQYNSLSLGPDLPSGLPPALPSLKENNKEIIKKCASFYLVNVANSVFNNPPYDNNQKSRSDGQYYFRRYHRNIENTIKGIKFLVAAQFDENGLQVASIQKKI